MTITDKNKARFWSKVHKTDGCWNWTAARDKGGKGYGEFHLNRKNEGAHRVSYVMANGQIPPGLFVLHDCDNMACVRPDHLHLGTLAQNTREAWERNRMNPHNRGVQFCKRGHAFNDKNTCVRANGTGRKCRKCGALYKAADDNGSDPQEVLNFFQITGSQGQTMERFNIKSLELLNLILERACKISPTQPK